MKTFDHDLVFKLLFYIIFLIIGVAIVLCTSVRLLNYRETQATLQVHHNLFQPLNRQVEFPSLPTATIFANSKSIKLDSYALVCTHTASRLLPTYRPTPFCLHFLLSPSIYSTTTTFSFCSSHSLSLGYCLLNQ